MDDAHLLGTFGVRWGLEQSAADLKSLGTDRVWREGKLKEFREKFFLGIYTFETLRPMALVIGEGEPPRPGEREIPPSGIGYLDLHLHKGKKS